MLKNYVIVAKFTRLDVLIQSPIVSKVPVRNPVKRKIK